MENYFQSKENFNKSKAYFLQVIFQKKSRKQSLSHTVHNSYKYYLLLATGTIFSFTPSIFLMISSFTSLPFTFSLFSHPHCLLSLTLVSSLSTYFSLYMSLFSPFLFPPITPFSDKVLFFFPHKSVNSSLTIWYFGIYQTNCTRIFF